MTELRDNIDDKMQEMHEEADSGQRKNEQPFQRWLGDQIMLSGDHLTT